MVAQCVADLGLKQAYHQYNHLAIICYSIRINDQWRICFEWKAGRAENVEVTDYH